MKSTNLITSSLFALLTLMITVQPAAADTHPGRYVLGLATEPTEDGAFLLADRPLGDLTLHLMVYGYEHSIGIRAWDFAVVLPDGVTLDRTEYMGRGVNSRPQPGYYKVTTREILEPENGLIHLATLHLTITDTLPQDFFLAPAALWGSVGGMEYARATDESLSQLFNWPMGCNQCPVFSLINTPQAADDPSLDWVKSLFR